MYVAKWIKAVDCESTTRGFNPRRSPNRALTACLLKNEPATHRLRKPTGAVAKASLHRAIVTAYNIIPDGPERKTWTQYSVLQVEDLKAVIRILLLWLASIFLSTPIVVQLSLIVLQGLDLHFKVPTGCLLESSAATMSVLWMFPPLVIVGKKLSEMVYSFSSLF